MNEEVIYLPTDGINKAIKEFSTPFFIYEEKKLRENLRTFRDSFTKYFPDFWPLYAVKANPNPEVLKIVKEEGFGTDCSSEAEAFIAEKLGMPGMYTGNYTTKEEFKYILDKKMIFNLDDVSMVEMVKETGCSKVVSFRINPGISKGGMESLVTAGPKAKYGVPFEKAAEAYELAKSIPGVEHFGIHMMTGSNIPTEAENYFAEIVEKMFKIIADIRDKTEIEIEFMNIGGGFGVPYNPEEKSLDMDKIAKSIRDAFDRSIKKYGVKEPRLMAEPGRFIGANAGWMIGKVHVIKDSYKKFAGIDAGSTDLPRPSIYDAYHYASLIKAEGREASAERESITIVGRICENNDQLAKDRELPIVEVGDYVAIHNAGAHAHSMGHNYNGRPRSAEYLLQENGDIRMIRRAETIEDLYKTTEV